MTREEFEQYYANNSGCTWDRLKSLGMYALPCDCGSKTCQGWQMMNIPGKNQNMEEIDVWRRYFLDQKLQVSQFRFIDQRYKDKLTEYFMACPFNGLKDPDDIWDSCLCSLLQSILDKNE